MRSLSYFVALGACVVVAGGCGSSDDSSSAVTSATPTAAAAVSCPAGWKAGWQKLANDIRTPVYCPSWMPEPLDGKIGGPSFNGRSVNERREYLVSFAWVEPGGPQGVLEVHVNFRAYPGRSAVPVCEDTVTVNGKTVHPKLPCFSDSQGTKRVGGKTVTVYTANQGADSWHILYAWHHRGSLYSLSEHVAAPYTYKQVVENLDRMMQGLVRLTPSAA
jgi:hypothetical protein